MTPEELMDMHDALDLKAYLEIESHKLAERNARN